ncbi:formin [Gadus chalcogrammus]|uniref:formin n=1 Tax=Gadus chalcogrammus TaxID=1042646 RepID=UPI0024C4D495|nr:formin [Gadus chalcogrammus]
MSLPAFPPSSPLPVTSTMTRTTFSPSSPTDKPLQLPALFSGLRVFRKGVMGPENDTVAQIKSLLQGSKKELDPEVENNPEDAKVQRRESILDHLSQLLNRRENGADKKEEGTYDRADESELFTRDYKPVIEEEKETDEMESIGEDDINRITDQSEEPTGLQDSPKSPVSGAEAAFDAFKAFFTPRPLRRDPSERFDLRKRIRSDKEVLKGLIERSANNTPGKESPSDGKAEADPPGDGEERTPGRLQAIWPPPRDEKVGLKYTEAEHQAALLQLKRECKEEEEKLQEDHGRALSRLREEHEENLSLARLHAQRTLAEAPRRGDLRDACVSTEDDVPRKAFRTVCVQTDRETFLRAPEGGGGGSPQQQMAPPKRLDLASISLSLVGQREDHAPPDAAPGFPLPPPPPPPPPLGLGRAVDGPPRKPAIEPTVPMKPLYWTRIQIQDKKSDSLWDSLEPPSLINSGAFEDLFAKGTTQANRKPLAEAYEKKTKARKIVKLLDAKRSQAVAIFISSLHLDMKDIKHAVLKVDHSLVDLETIEALYENRAQPEEVQRIRNHYETADQEHIKLLDKPEQFLYELSQIPDFAGRARCIIFQSAFNDTIASVHHKVEMVSSACTALREGPGVRAVVAVVLALGNHMNGGSRVRGQADGFGLDILPKLKDVKSQDKRMSLVDYVVSYYLHYVDQDAGTDRSVFPLPEPQDLFLASQVRMDDLDRDLRRLGRDLTVCEKDVLAVSSTSAEEHRQPFKDKMEAFLLTARKSHEEASDLLITSQKRFEAVVQYFGVRPRAGESEVSTAHFFLLWFEFCADFKTRWKKESKNVSKERLIEAQQSVRRITEDKKVEIRQVNPNSLKDRLRQRDRKASH